MNIIQLRYRKFLVGFAIYVLGTVSFTGSGSAQEVLKIGVLGVMSGPAASWGLVNKYCAETSAQLYNEEGGFEIGGKKYKIEIVPLDDKNDPKLAEQQMVVISRALMARPKLLLLDEPSLGLAPMVVRDIARAIVEIIIRKGSA